MADNISNANTASRFYKKNTNLNIDTNSNVFESMSGVNTTVLLEFPSWDLSKKEGALYIVMRSVISLSYSVYRAKIPVTPLGSSTVQGFALGNKTVAGSIIKTLTYGDEFTTAVQYFTQKSLANKEAEFIQDLGSKSYSLFKEKYKISQKYFDSIMRDDLVPFNIHSFSISEYTGKMITDSIYGCVIINSGQVQSIENLITENTFSFVASHVKQAHDITADYTTFKYGNSVASGSSLLASRKK